MRADIGDLAMAEFQKPPRRQRAAVKIGRRDAIQHHRGIGAVDQNRLQHTLRDAVDDFVLGIEADGEKTVHLADPLGQGVVDLFLVQKPDIEFEAIRLGKAAQHVENIVIKSADIASRPFGGHERKDFLALQRHAAGLGRDRPQRITKLRRHSQNLGLDRRADALFPCENPRNGADGNAGALGDIRLARAADVGRIVHVVSCACKKIYYDANIAN
ncbi:hypothetical protein D3C78_1129760 [compost metagenome]